MIQEMHNSNKEAAEMAEETVDLVLHTIHHQTINPPVIGEVAASLIRGIAELECEVSETCSYNDRISHPIRKRIE